MTGVFTTLSSRASALGLGALLLIAACGGNTNTSTGSTTNVNEWTDWGGQELAAYQAVLKPFTASTGIKVTLLTIRNSGDLIANDIAAGTGLPDIAPGPNFSKVPDWAHKGILKPAETYLEGSWSSYISSTYPALTSGAQPQYIGIVDGKHYETMVKTQVKGLFWFNKKVFTGTAPANFNDLLAISPSQYGAQKLFCAGLESGSASGWPASDQIDNIIMRQSGDKVYANWIAGKQKFTSAEIKLGYQTYLKEVSAANVYGGPNTVLATAFQRAGKPMFASSPGCLFLEQATFMSNFFIEDYPNLKAGTDFDFFAHPSMGQPANDGNVNGFYDQLAMYTDTPAARKLMQYLVTKDAQQIWADQGGTLAANKNVTYNDPVFSRAAQVAGGAKNLLVTAGDFMPSDMQTAFWKSLLDATNNPSNLDSILQHLDQVQTAAYAA